MLCRPVECFLSALFFSISFLQFSELPETNKWKIYKIVIFSFCKIVPDCTMDAVTIISSDLEFVDNVNSLANCHALCLLNPKCFGVVWSKPWSNDKHPEGCWLKTEFGLNQTKPSIPVISRPRYCLHCEYRGFETVLSCSSTKFWSIPVAFSHKTSWWMVRIWRELLQVFVPY